MNTLTCVVVLMCASMALAAIVPIAPESQPEVVVLTEGGAPVKAVALEETLEPQESAYGGYRRFGGGGFGGYRGFGGGFGHRRGFGGYGGGFGGFAVGGIAVGGFKGYGFGR